MTYFVSATEQPLPIHPGRIIATELAARGQSAGALARDLHIPANRITAIINGVRGITVDTALRLAHYWGGAAQFWLNLQNNYDLALATRDHGAAIAAQIRHGLPPGRERRQTSFASLASKSNLRKTPQVLKKA